MSVSVKTYDFTMPAGGAFQIQAVGSYFRIQTTTGPVRVQGEFGDLSPLLAGQGIKDSPFTRLMFTNLSAVSITGTVIVADKEFVDQQMVMSGTVSSSVLPAQFGAYQKVKSFTSTFDTTAVAGQGQFLNLLKTNTAMNVAITRLAVKTVADTEMYLTLNIPTFQLYNDGFKVPKDLSLASAASLTLRTPMNPLAVMPSGMTLGSVGKLTGGVESVFDWKDRPMVLAANQTFLMNTLNVQNTVCRFTVDWDEWP
jgi:hypothetical protein